MSIVEKPLTSFDEFTSVIPGCGRPVDVGELVLGNLVDHDRGLRRPSHVPFHRPPAFQGRGPSFSAERFADELRARLLANAKGWAFAVNLNGELAHEDGQGLARTSAEGQLAMTATRRLNIASVSKTITAVAVLRLLSETGKSIDDKIWPYLPQEWSFGPGVTDLRFRDLLLHRSGLTSTNSDFGQTLSYEGLATAIQMGGVPGSTRNYLNANYALFRVIIPALWNEAGLTTANNDSDVGSAFFYAVYVIEEIFGRMGVDIGPNASTSELDDNPTRYYDSFNSDTGISLGNWAMIAGGGGWHLSARELAAFLAHVAYTDDILDDQAREQMDSLALGWRPRSQTTGQFGQYLAHGGSIGGGGGRVRTAIVKFSIQCEASLVANSAIAGYPDPVDLLVDSFDAAWS